MTTLTRRLAVGSEHRPTCFEIHHDQSAANGNRKSSEAINVQRSIDMPYCIFAAQVHVRSRNWQDFYGMAARGQRWATRGQWRFRWPSREWPQPILHCTSQLGGTPKLPSDSSGQWTLCCRPHRWINSDPTATEMPSCGPGLTRSTNAQLGPKEV